MKNFGFLAALVLVISVDAVPNLPYYPPSSSGNSLNLQTYRRVTMSINCGTSPIVNADSHKANYNPEDFANAINKYGSALLAKNDVDPYGLCPWTVEITDENDAFVCAGVGVHQSRVLTLASCIEGRTLANLRVRFGDWDILNNINDHEVYQNFESTICTSSPVVNCITPYSPLELPAVPLVLLSVQTIPDHDQYPQVKPICLPEYSSSPQTNELSCWVGGYHSSPLIQTDNVFSKIPRHAQLKRITQSTGCLDLEEQWVGINGWDACIADVGTPIICYIPDPSLSPPSLPPSSPSPSGNPAILIMDPPQPIEPRLRAVVVAIVKTPAVACTVYNITNPGNVVSQPITAIRVSQDATDSIVGNVFQYPDPVC